MAMKFQDGFDMYSAANDLLLRGMTLTGSPAIQTTGGRFGGGSIECNSSTDVIDVPLPSMDGTAAVHWAAWVKISTLPATTTTFINFRNSADTNGCGIRCGSTGDLIVTEYNAGSTVDGSVAGCFADLGWHHIEMRHVFAASGSLKIWVDGVLQVDLSAIDTFLSGTPSGLNQFKITTGGSALVVMVDDLVIWDEVGSDFVLTSLGEHRIETRVPSADTAQKDFSRSAGADNYALIDETGMHDSDATYVQSTTIGHKDLYEVTDLGASPTSVHAVAVHTRAKKTDIGAVTMNNRLKSNATDQAGANNSLTSGYLQYTDYFGKDPNGSIAWDVAAVDAAQIGFKYEA